ncbi:MAG: AhpC/TSA family protein, partial [Saprospiraceae bacterium]|nr:AhpC/TSA family protein [Saprospiraceae bacterium]
MIQEMFTSSGESVKEASFVRPVLLVFLRHFGCVFCKEGLHDIAELREQIDQQADLIFVHMAHNDVAEQYFQEFKLKGVK